MFRQKRGPQMIPGGEVLAWVFSVCALLLALLATLWIGRVARADRPDPPAGTLSVVSAPGEMADAADSGDIEQLEGALIVIGEGQIVVQTKRQTSHEIGFNDQTLITLQGKKVTIDDLKPGHFVDVRFVRNDAGKAVAKELHARMVK